MLKLEIRGMTIPYSVYKRKQRDKTEKQLEKEIKTLQDKLNSQPSQELKEELFSKQIKFEQIRKEKMREIITCTKARWVVYGEKNSRYFCNLEKQHYTEKIIPKLVTQDKKEIYKQEEIIIEAQKFYTKLNSERNGNYDKTRFKDFVGEIENAGCKLNKAQKEMCEGEITTREALAAL